MFILVPLSLVWQADWLSWRKKICLSLICMANVQGQLNKGDLYHYLCLMSLTVSLVFPHHLNPLRPPPPPPPTSGPYLYLKVSYASQQHPNASLIAGLHLYTQQWCSEISSCWNTKQHHFAKEQLDDGDGQHGWSVGGGGPLPITVVRVVHSWAQAFGATLDEKLSNPSVRQRFMRFAKKHC